MTDFDENTLPRRLRFRICFSIAIIGACPNENFVSRDLAISDYSDRLLEALDEPPEWRFALQAMSVETRIGKRLAAIREHRRMSQADLAAALGVSKAAIGHYEHGRVRLTVPRLEQLALALHCRVADLLAPLDTPVPLGDVPA